MAGRRGGLRAMFRDRYGLPLSTGSAAARDAYVEAMDLFLAANAGAELAFARAAVEDPSFALAHAGRARALQMRGRGREAADAMAGARAAAIASSCPVTLARTLAMPPSICTLAHPNRSAARPRAAR